MKSTKGRTKTVDQSDLKAPDFKEEFGWKEGGIEWVHVAESRPDRSYL